MPLIRNRRERFLVTLSLFLIALPWLGPVLFHKAASLENGALASLSRVVVPEWYKPHAF